MKLALINNITPLLSSFDIPLKRKDLSKKENVRWLLRNLAIINSKNDKLNKVLELLKKLEKLD